MGAPIDDPVPDTDDLRTGVPVHDDLLDLLPLVGSWRGTGEGVSVVTGAGFRYGQQVRFVHDGRPFLAYESRSWLTDEDGRTIRSAWRESGFWRPGPDPDSIEAVVASNTGQSLVFAGAAADRRWELHTTSVIGAGAARPDVDGERRLYALMDEQLVYVTELAVGGAAYVAHLNAQLGRV